MQMTRIHTIEKRQREQTQQEQEQQGEQQEEEIHIPKVYRILIVEDEEPLLRYLVDELMRYNCIVLYAQDGKEGLDLALKECPDMIILDLIMPTMDGTTMLQKLRESDDLFVRGIPVLILTNVVDSPILTQGELSKFGVIDYLVKSDRNIQRAVDVVKEKFNISLL